MHSHLVAVEVRVERGADERMQLNGAALNEDRLKRLNAQTVQRRCTVQHDRMVLDDNLQCVPNLALRALYGLSCSLMLPAAPVSTRRFITNGLKSSSAISFGRPHWYIFSSGPTTITERPE